MMRLRSLSRRQLIHSMPTYEIIGIASTKSESLL